MSERVVAAYKPSELGGRVLEAAVEEAARRGTGLLIAQHLSLRGDMPTEPISQSVASTTSTSDVRAVASKAQADLEGLAATVRHRVPACDAVVLTDHASAAEAILSLAGSGGTALIVIGVRNRSRVGKAILGSDAQHILLGADCNVLAVK